MSNFSRNQMNLSRQGEDFPIHAGPQLTPLATQGSGARGERNGSFLVDYYRTISRYRWLIVGAGALGLLASFLMNLTTLPVYQARTSIDVQSLNGDFMNMRAVNPTSAGGGSSDESYMQTQIKLLQSDTLLDHTAARLKAEPHPTYIERKDLLSRWTRSLHLARSKPLAYDALLNDAIKHVKVKPLGLTRLIEITCDSWNAEFSAKLCNTLTTEFKEEDLQSRGTEAQKTSDWLMRQAEDVRLKAEDSLKKLEASVGGNGLILSQNSSSVGEERLRQIQQELVRAQADRMEREAQYAIAGSSNADTVPGVVDRPGYRNYQQKLADLRAKVAELVPPLTEENPKVIHLRSEIREVEAGLAHETTADTERIKNDYDASRHREALLAATYHAAEANVSADLGKAARVGLLRRQVESEQQLYQTLLQKGKEAGFASAMQAPTIHVVDAARPKKTPIAPQTTKSEAMGLVLGSLAGIGLAFFKDRHREVVRFPGDVERYFHVDELGVIPSAEDRGKKLLHHAKNITRVLARQDEEEAALPTPLALARWGDNFSIMAEAYRNATLSILLSDIAKKRSRTYVIASPNSNDGKTSVTFNLGIGLSRSKLRVLVIDGDLRRPALHTALCVPNDFGLRNLLRGEVNLDTVPASQFCKLTEIANLWILPSGSGNEEAVELLNSSGVEDVINSLKQAFDVILVDTPPVLHMADARLFARQADGAILVFRSGVTMRDDAADALSIFERDQVPVIGTILNDFDPEKEGQSAYYRSYYRYKEQMAPLRDKAS